MSAVYSVRLVSKKARAFVRRESVRNQWDAVDPAAHVKIWIR